MRVYTIRGDIKVIDRILNQCQIVDQGGNVEEFVAHGLDEMTRTLQNPLTRTLQQAQPQGFERYLPCTCRLSARESLTL